jgi:16S rRNA (guanine966-N2)-methyltransferase
MRVIAGKFKSRPLRAMPGMNTRPTSDRLRETLFNVLTAGNPSALENSTWLDLFAGTGAVGIEALSRGAKHVTFVDSSKTVVRVIRENLKSLGISDEAEVVAGDAARALRQLELNHHRADFVFVDPPYAAQPLYSETLEFLSQSHILQAGTTLITEHDKGYDPGEAIGRLRRYRIILQGDSGLSFYRRTE